MLEFLARHKYHKISNSFIYLTCVHHSMFHYRTHQRFEHYFSATVKQLIILRLYHCSYTMSMTFLRSVYPICTYITVGAYCVFLILESACNRLWTFPGFPVLLHILQKHSFAGSSVHMDILTIVIL